VAAPVSAALPREGGTERGAEVLMGAYYAFVPPAGGSAQVSADRRGHCGRRTRCGKLRSEMRRTIPLLATLFLLVCAQSAGLMHGIGHASARHDSATAQRATTTQSAPAVRAHQLPGGAETSDGSCDKCFQFAHFSGGAATQALLLPVAQTVDAPARGPQAALIARDAPASRSRGPPSYL
jgi:hypothetical protein